MEVKKMKFMKGLMIGSLVTTGLVMMYTETGMMNKKKMITPPILDIALERYLQSIGEEVLVKALAGVN